MTEKTRKPLKPIGSRLGVMYGSCKVHKASVKTILTNFVGFEQSYLETCEILSANFKTFDN